MTHPAPTAFYYGPRDRVIAEASAQDFYEGKYLVQPVGDVGNWDAEGCSNLRDLNAIVKQLRLDYPTASFVKL